MIGARPVPVRRHRARPRGLGAIRVAASVSTGVGVLAVVVLVAGLLGVLPDRSAASSVWVAGLATGTPVLSPSASASPAPSKPLKGVPTALRIPKISVKTELEQLQLRTDGSLAAPSFSDAGWYAQGTAPGDVGPAIIAGHIDSLSGPSVFYHLNELRTGDLIEVERDAKWLKFTVTSTGRYPKTNFPTAKVYGPTPIAELRLITCGGTFDANRGVYNDNFVVYAQESS
jgi:sortase (surface protein transpeptidase)